MNNPEIDSAGNKYWRNERWQFHCDHGPAIEYINGQVEYYIYGNRYDSLAEGLMNFALE